MEYVIMVLALVAACAAARTVLHNKAAHHGVISDEGDCASCSSAEARCSRECHAQAVAEALSAPEADLYYDDEELDVYRGRPSAGYTAAEAEQFAEVMLTMRRGEVAAWGRCLTLRGIELPDQVKDEFILLSESDE